MPSEPILKRWLSSDANDETDERRVGTGEETSLLLPAVGNLGRGVVPLLDPGLYCAAAVGVRGRRWGFLLRAEAGASGGPMSPVAPSEEALCVAAAIACL